MVRPNWDEYFMEMAHVAKKRSTCLTRLAGAVLVKDNRVISTGYNGTPSKTKHCNEGGCERCKNKFEGKIASGSDLSNCACCHAEENSIVQAALHGTGTKDTTLYTTFSPCTLCAKMIINAQIKRVVAGVSYPDDLGTKLLKEANVQLDLFKPVEV